MYQYLILCCATVAPLPFERVRSCPTDPRSSPVPSDDSPSCTSEIHVTVIERIHAELGSVSTGSVSAPSILTRGCLTPGPVLTKLLSKLGIINGWGLYSPFALAILADVSRDGSEGSPRSTLETLNCSRSTQPLDGLMPPCDSQDGLREIGQATVWIRGAVDLESDKHAFRPLGDWRSDKGMRPGSC